MYFFVHFRFCFSCQREMKEDTVSALSNFGSQKYLFSSLNSRFHPEHFSVGRPHVEVKGRLVIGPSVRFHCFIIVLQLRRRCDDVNQCIRSFASGCEAKDSQKSKLNHCTSQEPHGEKTRKEVSV